MLNLWTLSKWASTDHQCSTEISISCWRRKTVISILLPDWSDSTSHWSDGVSDKVTWLLKNHRRRPDFPIYDRIQFISIVFFIGWNHKAALQGLATTCLSVSRLPPSPISPEKSHRPAIYNQPTKSTLSAILSLWMQLISDYRAKRLSHWGPKRQIQELGIRDHMFIFYGSPFQASVSLI